MNKIIILKKKINNNTVSTATTSQEDITKIISDSDSKWVRDDEFELFKYLTINGKYYQYVMDSCNIKDRYFFT